MFIQQCTETSDNVMLLRHSDKWPEESYSKTYTFLFLSNTGGFSAYKASY